MKKVFTIDNDAIMTVTPAVPMTKDDFEFIMPMYGSQGSACFDFRMPSNPIVEKRNDGIHIIHTGLKFSFPSYYTLLILTRSSLSLKGIIVVNSPAVIDSDYTGEIKIVMRIPEDNVLPSGASIAQGMFTRVHSVNFKIKKSHPRGEGGFGSTD